MRSVEMIDAILAVTGAIMVYGAKNILKIVKREVSDKNVLILKVAGLIIAGTGLLRIIYS